MSQPPLRTALALLAGGSLALSVGCAYQNKKRDEDRQPVVHTGAGASIVWPNQTGPSFPPSRPSGRAVPQTGASSPPGPGQGSGSGSSTSTGRDGGRGGVTMIGGNESDVRSHKEVHQEPAPLKWLLTPFAVVAYPFVKIYQAVAGDDGPPEASTEAPPPTRHADLQVAHEQAELEAMERELARRGNAAGETAPAREAVRQAPRRQARAPSIAEELAALQRGEPSAPVSAVLPRAATTPELAPQGLADRVEDRDRNGRPDHWEYREAGQLVRELYDENGDGTPDRSVIYDPATGDRRRVDEDADFDGRTDSFSEFSGGQMVRRRSDADKDGVLDSWSFYRGGQLARHEQDRDGDGFRDRVGVYDAGQLVREEEDANGDGRPDRVTLYDAQERVLQRDEDRDGDGLVDMRSYYENGRLTRRELLGEDEAAPIETRDLESTRWEAGDAEHSAPRGR